MILINSNSFNAYQGFKMMFLIIFTPSKAINPLRRKGLLFGIIRKEEKNTIKKKK